MVKTDYKRKVTHIDYINHNKLKKYYYRVEKKIYTTPDYFDKNYTKGRFTDYLVVNDNLIASKSGNWIVPVISGSISFVFSLIFIFPLDEPRESIDWIFLSIGVFSTIFFIFYGFTMPKKENVLNRREHLITFPGFLWQVNITMTFDKAEFAYSSGGEDAIGAFQLQIVRPNKLQTFAIAGYLGKECYSNISFIVWYMDKNRPLPPGEVFDELRQVDFERRKAEGFPKPLYPSAIDTPEATPVQQRERELIGGW